MSLPYAYTIEIETADGEPMDIDAVRALLRTHDIKARTWAPGRQMLAMVALRSAAESVGVAHRMLRRVVGEVVDEEE